MCFFLNNDIKNCTVIELQSINQSPPQVPVVFFIPVFLPCNATFHLYVSFLIKRKSAVYKSQGIWLVHPQVQKRILVYFFISLSWGFPSRVAPYSFSLILCQRNWLFKLSSQAVCKECVKEKKRKKQKQRRCMFARAIWRLVGSHNLGNSVLKMGKGRRTQAKCSMAGKRWMQVKWPSIAFPLAANLFGRVVERVTWHATIASYLLCVTIPALMRLHCQIPLQQPHIYNDLGLRAATKWIVCCDSINFLLR